MDYILSLSYGKDSLACLHAIEILNYPLNRIVHAEIWATDTIPAELPEMISFKQKADEIIKQRYGITVEHIRSPKTYYDIFYTKGGSRSKNPGLIYSFPKTMGAWCVSKLKQDVLSKINQEGIVYLGLAVDEPQRIKRLTSNMMAPLADANMTEADCMQWCKENNLLSPIYQYSDRGGVGSVTNSLLIAYVI